MNKFYKISFEQFNKDFLNKFGDKYSVEDCYNAIQIPKGATKGSAGRDFHSPIAFTLMPGETITIPTGVKYIGATIREYYCNLYEPIKVKEYIDKNITILNNKYSKWKNKTIWICGTSITMGGGKGKSYIDRVGEILECKIVNVSVAGSSICCKLSNSQNLYKLPNDFRSAYLCFTGTLEEKNYIYEQENGGIYDGNNIDLETISNMLEVESTNLSIT